VSYVRKIIGHGDKRLHKKSRPCSKRDLRKPLFQQLVADMVATLQESGGVGLSAVQVGDLRRVCVMKLPDMSDALVFINPTIQPTEAAKQEWLPEGCLSRKGYEVDMLRWTELAVSSKNAAGQKILVIVRGVLAQCIQHELDHFEGVLVGERSGQSRKPRLTDAEGRPRIWLAS